MTAVNRDALLASARKYLNEDAVKILARAIEEGADAQVDQKVKPPLVTVHNRKLISALVNVSKLALARGERDNVKRFFAEIGRGKLIHGSGRFYTLKVDPKTKHRNSHSYGGPLIIELNFREESSSGPAIVVFYRLVNPAMVFGEKREGPRFTYPVGN